MFLALKYLYLIHVFVKKKLIFEMILIINILHNFIKNYKDYTLT